MAILKFIRYLTQVIGLKLKMFLLVVLYCILVMYWSNQWEVIRDVFIPRIKVTNFFIYTEGCKIPSYDPFHGSLRTYYQSDSKVKCSNILPLTFQEHITLKINKSLLSELPNFSHCQYEGIRRVPKDDFKTMYTDPVIFIQDIVVKEEFVRVTCYDKNGWNIYRNFHAFLLPKPEKIKMLEQKYKKHKLESESKDILNVMMVGIDSVSRLNHIVLMPNTRDYLLQNLSAIELEGYTKVADNTLVNMVPMLTGKFKDEEFKRVGLSIEEHVDDFNLIFKNFSNSGYLTLFGEDETVISIFNDYTLGFKEPPFDYYLRPFKLALDDDSSVWNNEYCMLNRPESEIILQYTYDLCAYHKYLPSFSFTFNSRLTHYSIPNLSTADDYYFHFFQELHNQKLLNNTVLFFFGDHGIRYGSILKTDFGKFQSRMPMMYLVFPPWFYTKYPQITHNLLNNAKKLTSTFDIYETLKDLLHFNGIPRNDVSNKKRGISLFDSIPSTRTCEDADIAPHWCVCKRDHQISISVEDNMALKTSVYLIDYMNEQLQKYRMCAKLKLSFIQTICAYKLYVNSQLLKNAAMSSKKNRFESGVFVFQMSYYTIPGNGEFEATVIYKGDKETFSMAGEISRLNKYGSSADCMKSAALKPYCYCS